LAKRHLPAGFFRLTRGANPVSLQAAKSRSQTEGFKMNIADDKEDFGHFYDRARRWAHKFRSHGSIQPEDVAHNAMIKLLKRAGDRPPTMGWLYKTVRSTAADAARAAARERAYVNATVDGSPGCVYERADELGMVYLNGRHGLPGGGEHELESSPQLLDMLKQLTNPLREVLILYANGRSYEQIAAATGAKVGTVRSRLHYARKRAKQLLASD